MRNVFVLLVSKPEISKPKAGPETGQAISLTSLAATVGVSPGSELTNNFFH